MPQQAGDVGRARWMAKGRGEFSPGEDRMGRQEAGGFVLARLHAEISISALEWVINSHYDADLSTTRLGRPLGR